MASIRKIKNRKKETYELDYRDPLSGVRKRKMLYCDHKTAVAILKETEARLSRREFGIYTKLDGHTAWKDLEKKFQIHSSKVKSVKTTKREKLVLKTFSKFIGNPGVLDIDTSIVEDYLHHRLNKGGISPATASIEHRVLKTLFNQAIKWQLIRINPANGIKLPRPEPIRVRYLLIDEVKPLFAVITNQRMHRLALLYLNTGARRSELLPPLFSWDNVDFDKKMLSLSGKGNMKRYIPMNGTVFTILEAIKKEGAESPFELRPDTITHKFREYYNNAGIENANVHSLRKTFGSLLIQNGIADLYTISKLLGHTSLKTTERYYIDLLDENYSSSVKQLEDILPTFTLERNA